MARSLFEDLECVHVYIYDVIIGLTSSQEHMNHLIIVCNRISEIRSDPKAGKIFLWWGMNWGVGVYGLWKRGVIGSREDKVCLRGVVTAVKEKELHSFLMFCSFNRRFEKRLLHIAALLLDLITNQAKFKWMEEAEFAFQSLKAAMGKPRVLALPEEGQLLFVYINTSNCALGSM